MFSASNAQADTEYLALGDCTKHLLCSLWILYIITMQDVPMQDVPCTTFHTILLTIFNGNNSAVSSERRQLWTGDLSTLIFTIISYATLANKTLSNLQWLKKSPCPLIISSKLQTRMRWRNSKLRLKMSVGVKSFNQSAQRITRAEWILDGTHAPLRYPVSQEFWPVLKCTPRNLSVCPLKCFHCFGSLK